MNKTVLFTATAETEEKYRANFKSKTVDYLNGYIGSYERYIGSFKGTFDGPFTHSEPLEITVAREVLKEKSTPRHVESSEGGC